MKRHYVNPRFEYKGCGIHDSWCGVEVWEHKDKYVTILTEPTNILSGTSVTNGCEDIATKLFKQRGVFKKNTKPENIIWIEHYPERDSGWYSAETFDEVRFEYDGRNDELKHPNWVHIGDTLTEEKMLELLNNSVV